MSFSDKPLQETEGDTFAKSMQFRDDDGAIDITGWTIYVTVKESLQDSDSDAVLSTTVTTHDAPLNGETSFSFADTETEGLESTYFFEIKFEDTGGTVETALQRILEFNKAVKETT